MKIVKNIASILLVFIIGLSLVSCENDFVNEAYFSHTSENTQSQNYKEISKNCLKIYFLSVGQADSILVIQNGRVMLIDGGNTGDGEFVCDFMDSLGITKIDVLVGTHGHEDHIGGFSTVVNEFQIDRAIVSTCGYDSSYYKKFINGLNKNGVTEESAKVGEKFQFGNASVQIIGPISKDEDDLNNTSVVLRLTYGKRSVLFTGDCSSDEEKEILNAGYQVSADVLKVGHHGSNTSSTYVFLREVMPKYAVIEVGEDNTYNLPNKNVLSRFRDAGTTVYRTDQMGTITCTIAENGEINFLTEEESNLTVNSEKSTTVENTVSDDDSLLTEATEKEEVDYIGNKNSKILHKAVCPYIPKEENQVPFETRAEAIGKGYRPCGYCNP